MRLFLLPVSTRRTLLYCERLREASATATTPGSKPPLTERVITKANETWISWEKAKGGWQKTITVWGNSLLRRISFEEYGLKSLPPGTKKRLEDIDAGRLRLKCLYPAAFIRPDSGPRKPSDDRATATAMLEKLAKERQSLHWNRLVYCLIGMPISAPFMIVPVIPNLPFYYLCYRAYCHYRALWGSKTLEHLLKRDAIDMSPSTKLEEIYTAGLSQPDSKTVEVLPPVSSQQVEESANAIDKQTQDDTKEILLLRKWNGALLAEQFQLPEMEVEIERAVEQVEKALRADHAKEQRVNDADTKGGKQS